MFAEWSYEPAVHIAINSFLDYLELVAKKQPDADIISLLDKIDYLNYLLKPINGCSTVLSCQLTPDWWHRYFNADNIYSILSVFKLINQYEQTLKANSDNLLNRLVNQVVNLKAEQIYCLSELLKQVLTVDNYKGILVLLSDKFISAWIDCKYTKSLSPLLTKLAKFEEFLQSLKFTDYPIEDQLINAFLNSESEALKLFDDSSSDETRQLISWIKQGVFIDADRWPEDSNQILCQLIEVIIEGRTTNTDTTLKINPVYILRAQILYKAQAMSLDIEALNIVLDQLDESCLNILYRLLKKAIAHEEASAYYQNIINFLMAATQAPNQCSDSLQLIESLSTSLESDLLAESISEKVLEAIASQADMRWALHQRLDCLNTIIANIKIAPSKEELIKFLGLDESTNADQQLKLDGLLKFFANNKLGLINSWQFIRFVAGLITQNQIKPEPEEITIFCQEVLVWLINFKTILAKLTLVEQTDQSKNELIKQLADSIANLKILVA